MGSVLQHFKNSNPQNSASVYAIRSVLKELPELAQYAVNKNLLTILNTLNEDLFLSKAIYFDKPAQSNWYVTWHQDKTINVVDKIETDGYTGWTKKGDAFGVCPPQEVLDNTVAIRIHLDDTTDENGALRILPGSHKKILDDTELKLITENSVSTTCEVRAGGIQIMKPLLLHASSKTTNNRNRRVLHLEFNSIELPNGLEWVERLSITNTPN